MKGSFVRVAAVSPQVFLGCCEKNQKNIGRYLALFEQEEVEIALFPELSLTGATCGDLFFQRHFQKSALEALNTLVKNSSFTIAIVGLPFAFYGQLYNVSAVFQKGKLLALVPKNILPHREQSRWFTSYRGETALISLFGQTIPFGNHLSFTQGDKTFRICLGVPANQDTNHSPLVFIPAASPHFLGKEEETKAQLAAFSRSQGAGVIYANAGLGESTTDQVFSGALAIYEKGTLLKEVFPFSANEGHCIQDIDFDRLLFKGSQDTFQGKQSPLTQVQSTQWPKRASSPILYRDINPAPFIPPQNLLAKQVREVFAIQARALESRLTATGIKQAVLGVSGGLDSTLALLSAAYTFKQMGLAPQHIHALIMPGFGTTKRTKGNAEALARLLGCTVKEIDIIPAVRQHFKDIAHPEELEDVTYENSQARERTQILMDYANQVGGLVLGTGNLSENALGFSTYNGDHMSMYALNASIPKTFVKVLVAQGGKLFSSPEVEALCLDIVSTPISPELLPKGKEGEPTQKTEEILGSYDLHDFFLYHVMDSGSDYQKLKLLAQKAFEGRFSPEEIERALALFLRRFVQQQYKRSCTPDGPQIAFFSLSPRGGFVFPSDLSTAPFLP